MISARVVIPSRYKQGKSSYRTHRNSGATAPRPPKSRRNDRKSMCLIVDLNFFAVSPTLRFRLSARMSHPESAGPGQYTVSQGGAASSPDSPSDAVVLAVVVAVVIVARGK